MGKKKYTPGQPIAWSASRVESFQKCPRMFFEQSLTDRIPYAPSEQQTEGNRVHKLLDDRVRNKTALPIEYKHLEPLVQSIENAPGQTFGAQKLALDRKLQPCGWFDDGAWVRVETDISKVNLPNAFVGDWKTGKPTFSEYQLKLYAGVQFLFYQSLEKVTTAYIWLKTKMLDPKVYTRDQLKPIWSDLLQVPMQMQEASQKDSWPERPGRHCGWCGVNKQGRCMAAAEKYRGG